MNFKMFLRLLQSLGFAKYLIISMHFFGLVFMLWQPTKDFFVNLTPINLLVSGILLAYHHNKKTPYFYGFFICIAIIGFTVEVLGVKTGVIFGEYWYGKTLGIKLLEVPLLIGLNWAVLVVATANLAEQVVDKRDTDVNTHTYTYVKVRKSIIGATFMTGLDYLIEPIAMYLDFWQWQNNSIPLQNYIAWFVIAFCLHFIYQQTTINKRNHVAITLLIAQILFFGVYNLLK
jgi:putative membrane protein